MKNVWVQQSDITVFKIDLIVWKWLETVRVFFYGFQFKIDLIVWKYRMNGTLLLNIEWFKIDLIVWK